LVQFDAGQHDLALLYWENEIDQLLSRRRASAQKNGLRSPSSAHLSKNPLSKFATNDAYVGDRRAGAERLDVEPITVRLC
jgi:hypothetical protein